MKMRKLRIKNSQNCYFKFPDKKNPKMAIGRKWVLKQHFSGEPKLDDFELVEEELPELKNGEIMFRFKTVLFQNRSK